MVETEVRVHELSSKPTEYWRIWKKTANVMRLQVSHPSTPPTEDKLRFVCMSDTHSLTSHIRLQIPDGDVFVHAGDFTRTGALEQVKEFNSWIAKLPHKYKIVIAGNHELGFDSSRGRTDTVLEQARSGHRGCGHGHGEEAEGHNHDSKSLEEDLEAKLTYNVNPNDIRNVLTNCTYLEDSSVEICGLKIYGTPWQPEYGRWAFNLKRGEECLEKWNQIPSDTDVLITHSPPLGFGDLCSTGVRAGCVDLLHTVQRRVKPKYHVYGHIHEGYGVRSDGKILFINASTCDINYRPCNPAIVFDVTLPSGHNRSG